MNNHFELTFNGKTVGLIFGMIAAEEFMAMQIEKTREGIVGKSPIVAIADAMYAAAVNYSYAQRKKSPDYADFLDMISEMYSDEEGIKQIDEAGRIWHESRFGKEVFKTEQALKKKLEEIERVT